MGAPIGERKLGAAGGERKSIQCRGGMPAWIFHWPRAEWGEAEATDRTWTAALTAYRSAASSSVAGPVFQGAARARRGTRKAKIPVPVGNPAQVRAAARACGQRTKTDRIDAAMLTDYGRRYQPKPTPQASRVQPQLVALTQWLKQLVQSQTLTKSQAEHHQDRFVKKQHQALLDYYQTRVFGWQLRKPYRQREKEIAKQPSLKSFLFLFDLLTGHEPERLRAVRRWKQCGRCRPLVPGARWKDWFRWWTSAHFGEAQVGFPVGKICLLQNTIGLSASSLLNQTYDSHPSRSGLAGGLRRCRQ